MTTLESEFRLRELHSMFLVELDRRAHDNAVKLLKQIGKESRSAAPVPDVPTSTVEGRLGFWRQLYDRARALNHSCSLERSMQLLECMRLERA